MNLRIKNNLVILAFENSHWIYHFFLTKIKREFFLLCSYVIDIFSLVLGFSLSLIIMEQYFLWIEKKFIQLFAPLFFVYSLWLKKMLKKKRIKQKKKKIPNEWELIWNIFSEWKKIDLASIFFTMFIKCPKVGWLQLLWCTMYVREYSIGLNNNDNNNFRDQAPYESFFVNENYYPTNFYEYE